MRLSGTLPLRRLHQNWKRPTKARFAIKARRGTPMAFCNMCGAQVADGITTCPACAGRSAAAPAATTGMADNVAGMLAYVTIIPAIIFLVMEPYNKNRFVRFHAFQCLFFCVALVVIHIGLSILGV